MPVANERAGVPVMDGITRSNSSAEVPVAAQNEDKRPSGHICSLFVKSSDSSMAVE